MKIFGIDTGSEKSACLCFWPHAETDGTSIRKKLCVYWPQTGIFDNENLRHYLRGEWPNLEIDTIFIIESICSFMMRVGNDVFETVRWEGIFAEAINWRCGKDSIILVPRKTVVAHICGLAKGNDADIRAALIDRFPTTSKDSKGNPSAIGTKKYKGPLWGIKSHLWSALALAVYYAEQQEKK